jgi:hypothetical protein
MRNWRRSLGKAALALGLVVVMGPAVLSYRAASAGFDEVASPAVPDQDKARALTVHAERYLMLKRIGRVSAPLGLASFGVGVFLLVQERRRRSNAA